MDVGHRLDKPFPGYEIQLAVAGVVRASADHTATGALPAAGSFTTASASFTTVAGDAGQSLEIRLVSSGSQVSFDNVRLSWIDCSGNTPPVLTITGPADGAALSSCESIDFTVGASDLEDGDLSAAVSWTSSIDGALGTGASLPVTGLSAASHTITASVTDSGGLTASDTIQITVVAAPTLAITVAGASFEVPVLADGVWTTSTPWWDLTGNGGIYNPMATAFPDGVPDGANSYYGNGGTLAQTITAETVLADTIYSLSVEVGNRADKPFPGYEIQLLVAGLVRASESTVSPAAGTFATASASFISVLADGGQSLEIRLVTSGNQVSFDRVVLTRSVCD